MTTFKKISTAIGLSCALLGTLPVGAAPHIGARMLYASASYIGIGVMDVSDEAARQIGLVDPHGIEISSVADGSPGEEAGLQRGDIVLTYRDERVNGYEHFARLVRETPPGRTVELGLVRDSQRRTVEVEIGRREASESVRQTLDAVREHLGSVKEHLGSVKADHGDLVFDLNIPRVRMNIRNQRIGIELEKLEGQLAKYFGVERGLLVRSVGNGSIAEASGIRAGDVIVAVDGEEVSETDDLRDALASARSEPVTLEISRDRERASVQVDARPER